MAELDVQPLADAPANPAEWSTDPTAGAPGAGLPEPPAPPAVTADEAAAAVRTLHYGLWTGIRADQVQPLDPEELAKVSKGLVALAERIPVVAWMLKQLAIPDPDSGLLLWARLEARAHQELLPQPIGTGAKVPDGWVSRGAAWIRGLGRRRQVVAPDLRAGANGG